MDSLGIGSQTKDGLKTHFGLGVWDMVAIGIYFLLLLGVGFTSIFRRNRETVSGFFLAGRFMPWLPVGFSLFASNIGSEHFIGLSGTGAASGLSVGAFEFNALVLLQLLGFVFLPVFIASKVCTLPEYMMKRFGGQRIRMYLAVLSMVLYVFTKISVNLYSGAIFIQQALEWNIYLSIFVLLAITTICIIVGGLAAVVFMDVIQVTVMVAGSAVLLYRGLDKVGGWNQLQEKYMQAIPDQIFINPYSNKTCGFTRDDSWQILRDPIDSDMPWPGFLLGQTPASIWYWCADQLMVQKALAAKSLSHAQGGTLLTGWIKVLPMFLIVVPGMISRVLYPNEVGCVDPDICYSICQNRISCSNIAYPRLVLGIMPPGFRGIMVSVMLAALISDLTSIFNSSSTLFTIDIYRRFRVSASQKELILVGRLCILALVGISIGWIPIIQQMQGGQLYIYIQSVAAYLSPPIAVVFLLAITWRRVNEAGAFWGLMIGLVVGVIRMVLDFSYQAPLCMEQDTRPNIVTAVHYMYFATILFWLTGIVVVIISLLTPPNEEFRLIRSTFATRLSKELRPDDDYTAELARKPAKNNSNLEMSDENKLNKPATLSDMENSAFPETDNNRKTQVSSFFQIRSSKSKIQQDQEKMLLDIRHHLEELSGLKQTKNEKIILYFNLVLIFGAAIFFYVYFSINPFTLEEIEKLRQSVLNNRTAETIYNETRPLSSLFVN